MTDFVIPRPDWVGDDRDRNAGFQMYTEEGNNACALLVYRLVEQSENEKWRRDEFLRWLKAGVAELAQVHGEVRDTEPEWAIVNAVNAYFDTIGYTHIGRDDLGW